MVATAPVDEEAARRGQDRGERHRRRPLRQLLMVRPRPFAALASASRSAGPASARRRPRDGSAPRPRRRSRRRRADAALRDVPPARLRDVRTAGDHLRGASRRDPARHRRRRLHRARSADRRARSGRWRSPPADGLVANLAAPPAVVGHRLVFAWQEVDGRLDARRPSRRRARPRRARARSAVPGADAGRQPAGHRRRRADRLSPRPCLFARRRRSTPTSRTATLGLVYVSFGNVRDLQPWHGWVFEIDLDAWQARAAAAAAVTGTLVTTARPTRLRRRGRRRRARDGLRRRRLGGARPRGDPRPDLPRRVRAAGRHRQRPARSDPRQLRERASCASGAAWPFDARLRSRRCATGFDPTAPTDACAASVRPALHSAPPRRPGGPARHQRRLRRPDTVPVLRRARLGSGRRARPRSPRSPAAREVIVQPGKDGAVYLIDADHLGTLYDRAPIMRAAVARGAAPARATWAGTIVTKPAIATVGGVDAGAGADLRRRRRHPAGLQALEIDTTGGSPSWCRAGRRRPPAILGARSRLPQPAERRQRRRRGRRAYAAFADASPPAGRSTGFACGTARSSRSWRWRVAASGSPHRSPRTASSTSPLASTPARRRSRRGRRCWRRSRSRRRDNRC